MIVADANLLIYLTCRTPQTELARRVYASDAEWAVPILWEPEVLNALLLMCRAGMLSVDDAVKAWQHAASAVAGRVHGCAASTVLATGEQTGLTAYDAYYVALARTLGVYLITEDKKIRRACPDVTRSLLECVEGTREPPKH